MGVLTTMLAMFALATPPSCEDAQRAYEALNVEDALATARAVVAARSDRPLDCLEVAAVALMVLGRQEEARGVLTELFERAPERKIEDASLAPAMREFIEQTRAELAPLRARITARWIVNESLRLDVALDGGLRGATAVRYETTFGPEGGKHQGRVDLEGRAATATVAVAPSADVRTVSVVGRVVDALGREVHQFSSELLLPARPTANKEVVEIDTGGPSWVVWAIVGAAVVGSAVAVAVVAQPDLPDPGMSFGRAEVPR